MYYVGNFELYICCNTIAIKYLSNTCETSVIKAGVMNTLRLGSTLVLVFQKN